MVALGVATRDLILRLAVAHAGMPYPWVNLRHGVHANETVFETNTAAVGSFSIEMGLLSRLTGQPALQTCGRTVFFKNAEPDKT